MRIYLVSDMHYEFGRQLSVPKVEADVVILAGDISSPENLLKIATAYKVALRAPVISLAGNHEFYHCDFERTLHGFKKDKRFGIHFLENDVVTIGDTRFLGCTLWSNFLLYGPDIGRKAMKMAGQYINDFRLIRYGDRSLRPEDVDSFFKASYQWLDETLSMPFEGKTVVITHFAPHKAAVHPRYLVDGPDELTPYFTSDCSPLMRKHKIDAWLYGHTHNSVDVIVDGGTRLVSNQGGYPREETPYVAFDPLKIIDLG